MRKISAKKLAKLGGKMPFSTASRTAVKRKPRPKAETERIYGPPARRKWMKLQPCSACGVVGYSEGAHVLGNGGTGRKADADTQAPLCGIRPEHNRTGTYLGCHILFDRYRSDFNRRFPEFDPIKASVKTEKDWKDFKGDTNK